MLARLAILNCMLSTLFIHMHMSLSYYRMLYSSLAMQTRLHVHYRRENAIACCCFSTTDIAMNIPPARTPLRASTAALQYSTCSLYRDSNLAC